MSEQKRRNIVVRGRKTSVSVEELFWTEFKKIAQERGKSAGALVEEIDARRGTNNLSSEVRLFVLRYYMAWARLPGGPV